MRRRKAARPTSPEAHKPRTVLSTAKRRDRNAISPDFVMQALSVCDGQTCIGHLLPRGKAGVEAFDSDDRSIGIYPTQAAAANAISKVAGGAV
jgi:hypothetical protein